MTLQEKIDALNAHFAQGGSVLLPTCTKVFKFNRHSPLRIAKDGTGAYAQWGKRSVFLFAHQVTMMASQVEG